MKRYPCALVGLAVLMAAVLPVLAQKTAPAGDTAAKGKDAKQGGQSLADMQAAMIKECGLSEEQTTKLAQRVQAYKDALADWEKENGEKLAAALKAGKADPQAKALLESKAKLETDLKKDIDAILTAEQKAKWDAYQLYVSVCRAYAKAKLTDAQLAKVRELTAAAAKDIEGAADKASKAIVRDDLARQIDALLTDDQKADMARKKVAASQPSGEAQPKGGAK